MTTPQSTSMPDDLQAKLAAAGVTDNAGLQAALARDPDLRAEFYAWLMQSLLAQFDAVQDPDALHEFWRGVPSELEQPFAQTAQSIISSGQLDGAQRENWQAKLDDFKRICEEVAKQQAVPPIVQALREFVYAEDEADARKVFSERRALLQPFEAQRLLEAQHPDDAVTQQRHSERLSLLRQLRGAAPQPMQAPPQNSRNPQDLTGLGDLSGLPAGTVFDNRQANIQGDVYQAQTLIINNHNVFELEWRFIRPAPPALTKALVERSVEIDDVIAKIEAQGTVAISGKVAPNALTMQGMAGVGKTSLARLLAHRLNDRYPDGVLWTDIGPTTQTQEDVKPILKTWASCYAGGIADKALEFTPEAVRALMAEHPNVLVIFDNVWSLDAIKPLREALPPEAHQIITTRSLEIMRAAGGATHEVGLLSWEDALALLTLRTGWRPTEGSSDIVWVDELFKYLGRHPLALDIAFSLMPDQGFGSAEWREVAERMIVLVRQGTNFGDLRRSPEIDREANVEASLFVSYSRLDAVAQARFRQLGAFASEAGFSVALAAGLWQCDEPEVRKTLMAFYNRALLERRPDGLWGQHALLRGYALALLHRDGEAEAAASRHANACNDTMQVADNAQRYYEMWPVYSQMAHAFTWAVENDLDLALNLIGNCANLQAQWGKVTDNLSWSQQAITTAQIRGTSTDVARAQGTLANALARAATLPGEDRRARLLQALDAYDAALEFRRPDTAPLDYAATQNNRANLLSAIATLPGEDRRARLLQALDACDAALEFRRPDTAPLDYAMTQGNLVNLFVAFAKLDGEIRSDWLIRACRAMYKALAGFRLAQHRDYEARATRQLQDLQDTCGDDFAEYWAAAGLGEAPADVPSSSQADDLRDWFDAFAQIQNGEQMLDFYRRIPSEIEDNFISLVEKVIADVEATGNADTASHLQTRLEAFKQICEAAKQATTSNADNPLQSALQEYLSQREAAEKTEQDREAWQRAADAGEGLLSMLGTVAIDAEQLSAIKADIASTYNMLGNTFDDVDKQQALAAFDRAIALQPDFAMWHRNRAGTLIELGRLDDAEAAIARARELEPDAKRLPELDAELAAARSKAAQPQND